MHKSALSVFCMIVALAAGCGKGDEQAKEKAEPAPSGKPPAPSKAAKNPKPKGNSEGNQTTELTADERFLLSLRPLHEGKPSTLKIELEKIRAKGEPVTDKELDAWYKAVPAEKNAALAFGKFTNNVPENIWIPVHKLGRKRVNPALLMAPDSRSKIQAYLVAHQANVNLLFTIAQRYPANQPARFPIDCTRGQSTLLPHLSSMNLSTELLGWRSRYFATQQRPAVAQGQNPLSVGDQQQAVWAILVLLRICHLLDDEPIVISTLVEVGCARRARDSLETLLNMRSLNDAQLVSLQQAFAGFNWPRNFANAWVGERASILGSEEIARTGTKKQLQWIDPSHRIIEEPIWLLLRFRPEAARDLEMTTYIGMMNRFLEGIRAGYPSFSTYDDENGEFRSTWAKHQKLTTTIQHVGKYPFTPMMMKSLGYLSTKVHLAVLNQQLTTTALAIERYRLANQGRIPRNLPELVPKFLTSQPFDSYDGKPLRYRPAPNGSYELRSIKADEQGPKDAVANDYTFRVNPATRLK